MDKFSRAALRKEITETLTTRHADGENGLWQHANMRSFEIMRDAQNPSNVFVVEMQPLLRYRVTDQNGQDSYHDVPEEMSGLIATDPNGYEAALQRSFTEFACSIRMSPSYRDLIPAMSASMPPEEAINAVGAAIQTNSTYIPSALPFALDMDDLQRESELRNAQNLAIEKHEVARYKDSMAQDVPDLFKGLRNFSGRIKQDIKDRLLSFYNDQTTENWDKVARLIIGTGRSTTPWSIWTTIDPSAPRSLRPNGEWLSIPDRAMFVEILAKAAAPPEPFRSPTITADDLFFEKLRAMNEARASMGLPTISDEEANRVRTGEGLDPKPEPESFSP